MGNGHTVSPMERIPDRPEPDPDDPEYPAGTEAPTDPPGVDPDDDSDEQPGFSDDPPQAD
jgi:hypothetical protein